MRVQNQGDAEAHQDLLDTPEKKTLFLKANHFLDLGYPLQKQAFGHQMMFIETFNLQGIHEGIVPFQHSFHADFQRQFSGIFVY